MDVRPDCAHDRPCCPFPISSPPFFSHPPPRIHSNMQKMAHWLEAGITVLSYTLIIILFSLWSSNSCLGKISLNCSIFTIVTIDSIIKAKSSGLTIYWLFRRVTRRLIDRLLIFWALITLVKNKNRISLLHDRSGTMNNPNQGEPQSRRHHVNFMNNAIFGRRWCSCDLCNNRYH